MQQLKSILFAGLALAAAAVTAAPEKPQPEWKPVPDEAVAKMQAALPAKPVVAPAQPRKLLVFYRCEGFPHGSIPYCNKLMELMGEKTGAFGVTLSRDMSVFTAENLKQYDAILLNNTTSLKFADPAARQALLDFVRGGKGLIGIHAATDNFNNWPEAAAMLGGQFDGHPWTSGGLWAFKLDDPAHPLNASFGGKGFALKDEIYQIKGPYSRTTHRELISLDMSDERNQKGNMQKVHRTDKDFAVAWIKPEGKGRVFYCSLGHNNEIYWNPAVVAHYLAGIQYALGDLKVDDAPSQK